MTSKSAAGSAVDRNAFASHVREHLSGLGAVTVRAMFGGFGVSHDGRMFGLIDDGVLYFKVDDGNRGDYTALGLGAFFYPSAKGPMEMAYHRVPDEALDDDDLLCAWARRAIEAAVRAKVGAGKKKAKTGTSSTDEKKPAATPKQVALPKAKQVALTKAKQVALTKAKQVAPAKAKQIAPAKAKQVAPATAKQVAPATAKQVARTKQTKAKKVR